VTSSCHGILTSKRPTSTITLDPKHSLHRFQRQSHVCPDPARRMSAGHRSKTDHPHDSRTRPDAPVGPRSPERMAGTTGTPRHLRPNGTSVTTNRQPSNRGSMITSSTRRGIGQHYPGSQDRRARPRYFDPTIKQQRHVCQNRRLLAPRFLRSALGWIHSKKGQFGKTIFRVHPHNARPTATVHLDESYSQTPLRDKCDKRNRRVLCMIVNIDENMGVLMKKLRRNGKSPTNTLLSTWGGGPITAAPAVRRIYKTPG